MPCAGLQTAGRRADLRVALSPRHGDVPNFHFSLPLNLTVFIQRQPFSSVWGFKMLTISVLPAAAVSHPGFGVLRAHGYGGWRGPERPELAVHPLVPAGWRATATIFIRVERHLDCC